MGKAVVVFLLLTQLLLADIAYSYIRTDKVKYECEVLFNKYGIDQVTKSYKGWMRVCNNNKLHLYSKQKYIDKKDVNLLCNCFKDNYKTRDVEDIRSSR